MDYDASSVPIAQYAGDPLVTDVRQRCLDQIRTLVVEEVGAHFLDVLDGMIRSNSTSLHWSADRGKLLVVGATE